MYIEHELETDSHDGIEGARYDGSHSPEDEEDHIGEGRCTPDELP